MRTMTTLSFPVSESVHHAISELIAKDGYSINQYLMTAAAEILADMKAFDYLKDSAERADLKEFERILDLVPSCPPDPGDELPE